MTDPMFLRWHFLLDANSDGLITIADVWLWVKWVYFVPGDAIVFGLSQSRPLNSFFEIGPDSYGSWFSIICGIPLFIVPYFALVGLVVGLETLSRRK